MTPPSAMWRRCWAVRWKRRARREHYLSEFEVISPAPLVIASAARFLLLNNESKLSGEAVSVGGLTDIVVELDVELNHPAIFWIQTAHLPRKWMPFCILTAGDQ